MRVIGVGDNCIDYYVDENIGYPGGNPVNVLVYMKRYNIDCSYLGVVGNDDFGKIIIESITKKNIDVSKIKVLDGNTARSDVSIINGNRVFTGYDEGGLSQFKLDNDDIDYIHKFDLMVTSIWSNIENDLYKINIPIAFDMSDQLDSEIWDKVLPEIDYVFYSDDKHDISYIKEFLKTKYLPRHKVLVCTRGEYGSIAYDGHEFYIQDIVQCKVVDTMGAGDSYIAGFLADYNKYKDIKKAMLEGAKNSVITISYKGAW